MARHRGMLTRCDSRSERMRKFNRGRDFSRTAWRSRLKMVGHRIVTEPVRTGPGFNPLFQLVDKLQKMGIQKHHVVAEYFREIFEPLCKCME